MSTPTRLVLFDLDKTLFDHRHSLECGIQAVYERLPVLFPFDLKELYSTYDSASNIAGTAAVHGEISWAESEDQRIILFFQFLDLTIPTSEQCTRFKDLYEPAYQLNQRWTHGSGGVLRTLQSRGCKVAIVTNGSNEGQMEKINAVGIAHLLDATFISDEIGIALPDPKIIEYAMQKFGAKKETTALVGNDRDLDVQCAIDAGVTPVWFKPGEVGPDLFVKKQEEMQIDGVTVFIVHAMGQMLDFLPGRI